MRDMEAVVASGRVAVVRKEMANFLNRKRARVACGHPRFKAGEEFDFLTAISAYARPPVGRCVDQLRVVGLQEPIDVYAECAVCKHCEAPLFCYHELVHHYSLAQMVDQQAAARIGREFAQYDSRSKHYYHCAGCGVALRESDAHAAVGSNSTLDPTKKYAILKTIFKNVLKFNVQTFTVVNSTDLFADLVSSIYTHIKRILLPKKSDTTY